MRHVKSLCLVLLLAGCVIVQPQSFEQRIASAYQTNTAIRETAATLLDAGRISSDQGENVLRLTDQTRELLDASAAGDESGLDLATRIMRELGKFLEGAR